jgi:hypothetical protein
VSFYGVLEDRRRTLRTMCVFTRIYMHSTQVGEELPLLSSANGTSQCILI